MDYHEYVKKAREEKAREQEKGKATAKMNKDWASAAQRAHEEAQIQIEIQMQKEMDLKILFTLLKIEEEKLIEDTGFGIGLELVSDFKKSYYKYKLGKSALVCKGYDQGDNLVITIADDMNSKFEFEVFGISFSEYEEMSEDASGAHYRTVQTYDKKELKNVRTKDDVLNFMNYFIRQRGIERPTQEERKEERIKLAKEGAKLVVFFCSVVFSLPVFFRACDKIVEYNREDAKWQISLDKSIDQRRKQLAEEVIKKYNLNAPDSSPSP